MVVYANDSSFSVLLDVHAISLVNVHGTSRWLVALLWRMCCPPVGEELSCPCRQSNHCFSDVQPEV